MISTAAHWPTLQSGVGNPSFPLLMKLLRPPVGSPPGSVFPSPFFPDLRTPGALPSNCMRCPRMHQDPSALGWAVLYPLSKTSSRFLPHQVLKVLFKLHLTAKPSHVP